MFVRTLILCLATGVLAVAQVNRFAADGKAMLQIVKGNILKSPDKMPGENFTFRASADVRTYAQILAHIADSNFNICAMAKGEKRERSTVEKTVTDREGIVKALQESFTYCEGAWDAMTDTKAAETVKFIGGERTRLAVMNFNTMHDFEHYGNLVTYMRLKGIVPPSSEPRQ